MKVFRGPRWEEGAFVDGWVAVDEGRIVSVGRGAPPTEADVTGVLVPSLVNAHTHVGDFALRGRIPADIGLEALVAPPHGLKHRLLAETPPDVLREGMRAALAEAREGGTSVLFDFREGGPDGARALKEVAGPRAVVLGRPVAALPEADGLGLSAMRDVGLDEARAQRDAARRAGKRFAMHWSEAEAESVDALLDLAPDFAVHALHVEEDGLRRVAEAGIPLVACPRSNARLAKRLPDVRAWLDAGAAACLGSDNAMLQTTGLLDELRFAREALPDVRPAELVAMAVDAPRERLDPPGLMRAWREGEPADFVALAPQGAEPFAALFAPRARVLAWADQPMRL
jgi:cytosine/adenosine deaminase-related metal-dependent hydrolase